MTTSTATDRAASTSTSSRSEALTRGLMENWWLIALRGLFGVLFGIVAFVFPGTTILALVLVFAAYMLVDGLFSIIAVIRAARQGERWGLMLLQGIASLATGGLAIVWPGLTVLAFLLLIAAWCIVSGCLMLGAAVRLDAKDGRWWLALGGFAAVAFGVLLVLAPLAGALVLTWWLGAFALVFGVLLMVLAFKLRSRRADRRPIGAAPAAA